MMADHERQTDAESLLRPGMDALSTASDRIQRQLQFRRIRLHAAGGATRGDQRQQLAWLKLREQTSAPADPVRWLLLQADGTSGFQGRVNDED